MAHVFFGGRGEYQWVLPEFNMSVEDLLNYLKVGEKYVVNCEGDEEDADEKDNKDDEEDTKDKDEDSEDEDEENEEEETYGCNFTDILTDIDHACDNCINLSFENNFIQIVQDDHKLGWWTTDESGSPIAICYIRKIE